jgi:hypothetical protein
MRIPNNPAAPASTRRTRAKHDQYLPVRRNDLHSLRSRRDPLAASELSEEGDQAVTTIIIAFIAGYVGGTATVLFAFIFGADAPIDPEPTPMRDRL